MTFQKGSSKVSKKVKPSSSKKEDKSRPALKVASQGSPKAPQKEKVVKPSKELKFTPGKKSQEKNSKDKTKMLTQSEKSSKSEKKKLSMSSRRLGGGLDLLHEAVCREVACEGLATSAGYCRLHYIKNWKKIKRKEVILRERRLNQYIEELVAKYPDKYIDAIRQDLASDKDFAKVIYDLDLDEGVEDFDVEGSESVDLLIDNIKRDFDDESDAF